MGKEDDAQPPGVASALSVSAERGGGRALSGVCCGRGFVGLRCVAAVALGIAVLLSAFFWLPPFAGRGDAALGADPAIADIVASFMLNKSISEVQQNILRLENDIFDEIGVPNSTVEITSLQQVSGSEWTNVVFSIFSYPMNSTISPTYLSIIRSKFMALVIQDSMFHLTPSLFGNSSLFEVLKFPGGITIIPAQTAFLQYKPHASFNFTLNFPIDKVQEKTNELKVQMKYGLLLNSYENLYIKLTNSVGSTIDPPTIVQASIIPEVGNHQPSVPRMKQLAQKITNSSSGNLGLNHTVFGRVKQISLSSYLRHSLNSGGCSGAPGPAPHAHHHHIHHHHAHSKKIHASPSPAPAHAPNSKKTPSGCQFGYSHKPMYKSSPVPAAGPVSHTYPAPLASPPHMALPSFSHGAKDPPRVHKWSPAAAPHISASHLPIVSFGRSHPPSESERSTRPPVGMPSTAPGPQPSSAVSANSHHSAIMVTALLLCILPAVF